MKIRGHIGDWPVDLTLELSPDEWAVLGARLHSAAVTTAPVAVPEKTPADDPQWTLALKLLKEAQVLEGPALLAQLTALTGSAQAGKRLLVRLRHCPQIRIEAGADAPLYHWLG